MLALDVKWCVWHTLTQILHVECFHEMLVCALGTNANAVSGCNF